MEQFSLSIKELQFISILVSGFTGGISVRETARKLIWSASTASRVIKKLEDLGLVNTNYRGGMKLVKINKRHPLYKEILSLVNKSYGIDSVLRLSLKSVPLISTATVYGSSIKGGFDDKSDIDLIISGTPDRDRLNETLSDCEQKLGREINYTLYSDKEYQQQKKNSAFIKSVMRGPVLELL